MRCSWCGPFYHNLLGAHLDDATEADIDNALDVIKSSDKILLDVAENLGIQSNYDASALTPEQRQVICQKCLAMPTCDAFDTAFSEICKVLESNGVKLLDLAYCLDVETLPDDDILILAPKQRKAIVSGCLAVLGYDPSLTASCGLRLTAEESSGKMTREEREALGEQYDHDGSRLTPELRRALFESYWPMHLRAYGLRSPRYYEDKSQCLSVAEDVWPGVASYLKADRLRRGYVDPNKLIERLRELKPSENFELRKFHHPTMCWRGPTPLEETSFEVLPRDPPWVLHQVEGVSRYSRVMRKAVDVYVQDIYDHWDAVASQ